MTIVEALKKYKKVRRTGWRTEWRFLPNPGGWYITKDENGNIVDENGEYVMLISSMLADDWEEYRGHEILDKVEKEYLRAVIRPFRNRIKTICKEKYKTDYAIVMRLKHAENPACTDYVVLPRFTGDKMYKGMRDNMPYTLEELDL